ncbi:MAG: pitrilysin family protein [Crocinitomicaceae bacterium]|nr:pitrilysin family protein [Crocinitomicaceae bacterium]MDG1777649.1 pitrilysin family protein [Crocinitomicaceae bacterium]
MLKYDRFTLENGLTVLFHKDTTTPLAVVNTLYDVGARDESEDKTGFAHLFEHLMFGGSINIEDFDSPLQLAGGENNAFTSNDITNYYDVLPANNIETALWLESDRMLSLAFTEKSLEVQRNVVIEEFKQRYLNQPYGDVWLELRPLVYKTHPYKWATIGKELSHIEDATMSDVKAFFKKHYSPANAILCIAGNFELDEVKALVQKWYGEIPAGIKYNRNLIKEAKQTEFREKVIEREVPANAFYYAFKMPDRLHPDFFTIDTLSDALGRDKSSRLYLSLKKELNLVSSISAYITGSIDEGLLVISGKLNDGVSFDTFDNAFWNELDAFKTNAISTSELEKIMNKIRTSKEFEDMGILNRAMNLCSYELLGDISLINKESEIYNNITADDIQRVAKSVLQKSCCSLLKVKAKENVK